jgi:hypothetical protein
MSWRAAASAALPPSCSFSSCWRAATVGRGTKNRVLGASVREDVVVLLADVLAVAVAAAKLAASAPASAVAPTPQRVYRIQ